MFGFCNPDLNKRALIAPARSFKVNNKGSFRRDYSQDFPPVITLSSIDDKVEEKLVRVKPQLHDECDSLATILFKLVDSYLIAFKFAQ